MEEALSGALQPLFDMFARWIFVFLFVSVAASLLGSWFNSPKRKGKRGEGLVNFSMKIHLDRNVYHLIKDVTLPAGSGTTQIDHIVVSVYGVFVVETKNMAGWIFGDENQSRWTQSIYKKKTSFQNPLHQNYKHVKTLEKLLGLTSDQLHSVVVFIGESKFKTRMPDNVVWGGGGCAQYIQSKTMRVLEESDVAEIIKEIESGRFLQNSQTDRAHVLHLRTRDYARPSESAGVVANACPKCGSSMILRTAKRGMNAGNQFWGCSQYPRCKGLKKCASA